MRKQIIETSTLISQAFLEFIQNQKAVGILLILSTCCSLILANSSFSEAYIHFWHYDLSLAISDFHFKMSINHFINDALMAVFFLLVGLEIKREIYGGELSSIRKAALPLSAAIGGMIIPAAIYTAFNSGTPAQDGWGIPMATDIAFAIGILSLLGDRVPVSLKILLTALAVVDDLGAVAVIAFFYTDSISLYYLLFVGGMLVLLLIMNQFRVRSLLLYLLIGLALWYFLYMSGIHATLAGVLLAFAIPYNRKSDKNPLLRLEHALHSPVNFIIMPLFALANTAIVLKSGFIQQLASMESLGISLGLVLGKPIGICLFIWLIVRSGISQLPEGTNFKQMLAIGFLGGIGFTISIFIAMLAFDSEEYIVNAKISILFSSLLAGLFGYFLLRSSIRRRS